MKIKSIVIEGTTGDIAIVANERGAHVMAGSECIAAFDRDEPREARHAKALVVAAEVYGLDRKGRPAATNSMVHEVLDAIERVAGC